MHRRHVLGAFAAAAAGARLAAAGAEATPATSAAKSAGVTPGSFVVTKDGTALFYKDWGAGGAVVFIHGTPVNSDIWQYQMNFLAGQGLRCVAYDRRGHGRSGQPWHGYDYDTLADDLDALIEHLRLRDVTLVGHSMGGGEVVRYLSRHGSRRVARAVLVAATAPFPLKTADNPEGLDAGVFEGLRATMGRDSARFIASGAPGFFGAGLPGVSVSPETMQWGVGLCFQTSLRAMLECNRALAETDFRAEMSRIDVPVLVIHGDADQSAPLALTGRRSARLIPGSRLVVYEGAPHGLLITHTDRLNADLLHFIRG
jgi:non-heme chloroperoxidase